MVTEFDDEMFSVCMIISFLCLDWNSYRWYGVACKFL